MSSFAEAELGRAPSEVVLTRRVAAALYATGFLSLSFSTMMGLAVPLWAVRLSASPSAIGAAIGAHALLPLLLSIHGGAVMDQIGVRRVIVFFAAMITVLEFLYPLLPWVAALFPLQLLTGLAYQMCWVGAVTEVGRLTQGNLRHYGRFSFTTNLGNFIGPLLTGVAWSALGPWGAFALMGLWGMALTAAALCLPSQNTREASVPSFDWRSLMPDFASYQAAFELLRIPAINLAVLTTFLRIAAFSIQGSFYAVYLQHIGLKGSAIGLLVGASSLVGGLAALSAGVVVRVLRTRRLALLLSVTVGTISISATPLLPGFAPLLMAMVLFGLALGMGQPLMLSILSGAAGPQYQGMAMGLRATSNRIASLVVPVAMGFAVQLAGTAAGFYVTGAVLLVIIALVAAVTRPPAAQPPA